MFYIVHTKTGYCFRSTSFFIYLFVYLSARLRENGWTNLHEIFREGLDWPWDDLITFWVNSEKPRNATMLISCQHLSTLPVIGSSGSPVLPSSDWECNEFCYISTWGGVCCAFAPQFVSMFFNFDLGKSFFITSARRYCDPSRLLCVDWFVGVFVSLHPATGFNRAVKYRQFRNDSLSISGASSARCTLAQL